jgi:hypothetical protein
MTTSEIEITLVKSLNPRLNMIVPNVHWALFNYELDLLLITKSGYAWEIEIKTSKQDLIRDKKKYHQHKDYKNRIKYLYFAIPYSLINEIHHIPEHAGIFVIAESLSGIRYCETLREPKTLGRYKWSEKEQLKVARLATLRCWTLKEKLLEKKQ